MENLVLSKDFDCTDQVEPVELTYALEGVVHGLEVGVIGVVGEAMHEQNQRRFRIVAKRGRY